MRYSCVIRYKSEKRIVKFLLVLELLRGVCTYVQTVGHMDGPSSSNVNFIPKKSSAYIEKSEELNMHPCVISGVKRNEQNGNRFVRISQG